ncbi:MAG: S41 family peptidase [Ignavibacteria bacterium]|nr:S41 family peptidase [Ignavibacteria bacterium]
MKERTKKVVYPLLIVLFLFFTGTTFQGNDDVYDRINKNLDVFGKVYKNVILEYVDEIDTDRFMKAGIEGMLSTLDPYTKFYDEENIEELDLITTGRYGGVGVTIGLRDSTVKIIDVMKGYEAEKKGLRVGDEILEVDGIDAKNMKLEKIRNIVRGEAGTVLILKVKRDEEEISFNLTRQEIILKNISYFGFLKGEYSNVAYIKLDRFTQSSVNEFENTLKNFKSNKELKGLIIDLRGNGGGLLDAAIGILNLIIDKNNLLLITKGKELSNEKKYFSKGDPLIPVNIPLAVLIDKSTASASEILAGAVQDLDRGIIIGSTSFGKGLVQQIRDINNESKMKITIQRYYTPSGRWIQEKNYFKENKFGVFMNAEAYSQKEFKTMNGRIVYANGGITPDVEIDIEPKSEICKYFINKDVFFKFSNYYVSQNPGIKIFKSTDGTLGLFKQFIEAYQYDYISAADKKITELRQIAADKKYSADFGNNLNLLEYEIRLEKEKEFYASENEILKEIEHEINKRILSEKEQIENSLDYDDVVLETLKILLNDVEYKRILNIY